MRAVLVLALSTGIANAQPPPDPPPYPAPLPPPPPIQPAPPEGPQPIAIQLTEEERAVLQRGPISDEAHLIGGVANVFIGFGIGQAIQGRWSEDGWKFTIGGAASVGALFFAGYQVGRSQGGDGTAVLFIGGVLGFLVFHIWGAVDALVEPPDHNRRFHELRMRLATPAPPWTRVVPYVQPSRDHGGGTAGLVFRF